jgi:hypothetical protein
MTTTTTTTTTATTTMTTTAATTATSTTTDHLSSLEPTSTTIGDSIEHFVVLL